MRLLYGDPSRVAEKLEELERSNARKLAGTGCEHCAHGEAAWGEWFCMVNRRHPGCVFSGVFVPA